MKCFLYSNRLETPHLLSKPEHHLYQLSNTSFFLGSKNVACCGTPFSNFCTTQVRASTPDRGYSLRESFYISVTVQLQYHIFFRYHWQQLSISKFIIFILSSTIRIYYRIFPNYFIILLIINITNILGCISKREKQQKYSRYLQKLANRTKISLRTVRTELQVIKYVKRN